MYSDGKEGLFPTIPPHAEIEFDITLLGFMPRSTYLSFEICLLRIHRQVAFNRKVMTFFPVFCVAVYKCNTLH